MLFKASGTTYICRSQSAAEAAMHCTAGLLGEVEQGFKPRGSESTLRILWVYPKKSQCPIIIILSVDARSN